ncbi:MAG: DUF6502 family protein [Burkholderiales bacterium]|nr:DUF6502 family protein [Burkholderiales bacterium]
MTPPDQESKSDSANPLASPAAAALLRAVAQVLTPLVRLLIARGVTFQVASELLKRVYVRAGLDHFARKDEAAPTGTQLSLLTGLNRKEIKRLTDESLQAVAPQGVTSFAAAVHANWLSGPRFRDKSGTPLPLPRHARSSGDGPSFDELVRAITTDHRPAAVLEELERLGLVEISSSDEVVLKVQPFLSRASFADRLVPFAENLGDHAAAATINVLSEAPPFLERSVFSDELSEASVALLQQKVAEEWRRLHDELIAAAIAREGEDARTRAKTDQRLRVGLYFYSESTKKDASS